MLSEHLYQADALQVATCRESKSSVLVTSDERLRRASENVGLMALDPDKQERDIRGLFVWALSGIRLNGPFRQLIIRNYGS